MGVYIDSTRATNVVRHNVINNTWIGIQSNFASNNVFDSNRLLSLMKNDPRPPNEPQAGIVLSRSYNTEVLNNTVRGCDGSGALLFASTGNHVAGNEFAGFRYGIGLWFGADGNTVEGNRLAENTAGLVVEKSAGNTLAGNSWGRLEGPVKAVDVGHLQAQDSASYSWPLRARVSPAGVIAEPALPVYR